MVKKFDREAARQRRHARIRKTLSGTAETPRLNVFRSNRHFNVQLIDDVKGVTLASVSSKNLGLKNNNLESAQVVGKEVAKVAKAAGITKVVFDRGGYIYHGRIKALADAARAEGLEF